MREKCKSTSGATLVLALLFFLMCAMAGSVVLAAGTAASGRVAGLKQAEQQYYTVTSAAKTVESLIDGQVWAGYVADDGSETGTSVTSLNLVKGELSTFLDRKTQEMAKENYLKSKDASYTVKKETEDWTLEISGFDNVKASVTMDENYNIKIYFTQVDKKYSCTLIVPAAIDKNIEEQNVIDADGNSVTQYFTHLIWTDAAIEKGKTE